MGLTVALVACSSATVVLDAGLDASSSDAATADSSADASVDATVTDSGQDSTLGDAGQDSTLNDADATDGSSSDATACSDAAPDVTILTLASTPGAAGVAVDGTYVYWTALAGSGSVEQCAIGGCGGTPTSIVSGLGPGLVALGIAVDTTNLYWTISNLADAGSIMTCPKAGCDGGAMVLAGGVQPEFIAIDGTNVYWTDWTLGTVNMCAKTGCGGKPTVLASGQKNPSGIAVDDTTVYWGDNGGGAVLKCNIASCADGGTPVVLLSGLQPAALVLDNANVYVTHSYATGAIIKVPKDGDGGTYTVLANNENGAPIYIATDGVNVYWTLDTTTPDNVRKCGVDGCCSSPTTIAPTQHQPYGIAVDGTHVYWVTYSGGTAMQLTPK